MFKEHTHGRSPLTPFASSCSWADISARVTSLAFSPSGTHLAASSLDESVRVYSLKTPSSILALKNLCVEFIPLRRLRLWH